MFTRHIVAAVVILAVALIGPAMLPGKTKIAAQDQPAPEQLETLGTENS